MVTKKEEMKQGETKQEDEKLTKKITYYMNTNGEPVTKEQMKLFNLAMENIKSFSTAKQPGKRQKQHIGIVAIDLSLLYMDERYQGLRKHKNIRKLINHWDERKLGAIIVVPHPEDYCFAVVDGQGRVMAAKELGYETLQAIVLLDAPTDEKERLKFEAEIFVSQDDETEDLKALEKHLARLIIEDEAALALERMAKKYNVTYTSQGGARDAGVLGSYPTTYTIAKRHGEACLDYIFSIIKEAGWDKESNGYATFVTESLKEIWTGFQEDDDRKEIYAFLSKALREITPTLFSSNARAKYPMRSDTRRVCTLYLEDLIFKNLGLKKAA